MENSLRAIRACLTRGWGVEIDIRRSPQGVFYLSHNPASCTENNCADTVLDVIREADPRSSIAVNIKELGYEILEAVESDNITEVGRLFDAHWQHKKKISTKMSNPQFDKIYEDAKANGALGGKISGAGGGGFFAFYVESNHEKFRKAMQKWGLQEMRYGFDWDGSKALFNL